MRKAMLLLVLVFVLCSVYVVAELDTGNVILYHTLDDGDLNGTDPIDVTGNGHNGTNSGATTGEEGIINESFFCDGTDQVVIGDVDETDGVGELSVAFWLNVTTLVNFDGIFEKYVDNDNRYGISLGGPGLGDNDDVLLHIADGANSFGYSTSNVLVVGQWVHIVLVFNGSGSSDADKLKLYVNGTDTALTFSGTIPSQTDTNAANLGYCFGNGGQKTAMGIDEFSVWNVSLTADQVSELNLSQYPFSAPLPPITGDINISGAIPANESQFNVSAMSFNATVNSTRNFTAHLYINQTLNFSQSYPPGNDTLINFSLSLTDGEWVYRIMVNFTNTSDAPTNSTTANNTFFIDTVFPIISANFTNFSVVMQFNLSGHFNFSDEFMLYGYNVSIDGVVHESLTDLNVSFYQYNLSFYAGNFSVGRHNLSVSTSDGHTATRLGGDYRVSDGLFNRYLEYDFWDYGYVNIREKENSIFNGFTTKRERDRYSFSFEPSREADTYTFVVESNLPISIIDRPDNEYGRWLIMGTHWLDFYMPSERDSWVEMKRIDAYTVEVTVGGITNKGRLDFSSIGDLNIVTAEYVFVVTNSTVTYDLNVLELSTNTIGLIINKTADINWTNATLVWNNTDVNVVKTSFADYDFYNASFSMNSTPEGGENVTFVWQYNITGASGEFGNLSFVQTIFSIGIDNCTVHTTQAMNFSLVNESNNQLVNGSIEGHFVVWVDEINDFKEFDLTWGLGGFLNTTFGLCIDPNSATYNVSAQLEYSSVGFTTRTHYLTNLTINNITQFVNLILTPDTSTVTFSVTDQNDNAVEGILIYIEAYDIAMDSSTLVQIVKTDGLGIALAELVLDQKYKFRFVLGGQLIPFTSDPIWITTTSKNFRLNLISDFFDTYDIVQGVVCALSYNNDTNNFSFAFTDPSGGATMGCLKIAQSTLHGEILISQDCISSASGTITATIGNSGINTTDAYIAHGFIFIQGSRFTCAEPITVSFNERWKTFGLTGVFVSLLLVISLVGIGIWHPVPSIILMVVGVVGSVFFDIFHLELPILVSFIILAVITLYRLRT